MFQVCHNHNHAIVFDVYRSERLKRFNYMHGTVNGLHIYPCPYYSKQWPPDKQTNGAWQGLQIQSGIYVPDKEYNPICNEASHGIAGISRKKPVS